MWFAGPARRAPLAGRPAALRLGFTLKPGMSYQVADGAEPHRSQTTTGARLFIVD